MPLRNSENKIIGTFGVSRNITEFVQMRLDLENNEKEMKVKESKIIELQEEIKQKKKVIAELEKKNKS
jgi:ribosomal protein S13